MICRNDNYIWLNLICLDYCRSAQMHQVGHDLKTTIDHVTSLGFVTSAFMCNFCMMAEYLKWLLGLDSPVKMTIITSIPTFSSYSLTNKYNYR